MTDLRTAAQQALEALTPFVRGNWTPGLAAQAAAAMACLEAALAEPVQEPDSPERRCGGPGCDMRCCQPVQEPWWAGMKPEDMVMTGVREYAEGYDVILSRNEQGRWLIEATNEGGHNGTAVDLLDLLQWLRAHGIGGEE